ncbi:MAG: 4-(cytidine 5'-diphospho)-2-C-methyl-D-erythritol kinase, partial [Deltaproteobacteria bacterium]
MISFPNAKINIGLAVTGKRPDGFHTIETVMVPVKMNDILEMIISPNKEFSFSFSGIPLPGDYKDNLVYKAYQLMKKDFNLPEIHIHLHKIIPIGSGLGGGSSDAAFALKLFNQLFNLDLPVSRLNDYAAKIGSDCSFFIQNHAALATGKGEILEPLNLDLDNFTIVIVKPDIHISTAQSYSWIRPAVPKILLAQLIRIPVSEWKGKVINDFEPEIIKRYPIIEKIRDRLYENGATYSSLTGSGAAVYGLFEKETNPDLNFPG